MSQEAISIEDQPSNDQRHNLCLIASNPYKLIVQAKIEEKQRPQDVEPSKTISKCITELLIAEGKRSLILLDKFSIDYHLKDKHIVAIKRMEGHLYKPKELTKFKGREDPCGKWHLHTSLKKLDDSDRITPFEKTDIKPAEVSNNPNPYLLIGTAESFANRDYDEVKIIVPIHIADELYGYEMKSEKKLKNLTEDEEDLYFGFRMAAEKNVTESGAFCKITTARIYGTGDENGNNKDDFNVVTVCDGARVRSAIFNGAGDLSTTITSFEPIKDFKDLNQQQVAILSFSRERFEILFGQLGSLLNKYQDSENPTIFNDIQMKY